MPVPQKMDMTRRKRTVKVYFNAHEFMKLKKMADTSNLGLSPFIRQKVLSNGILLRGHKGTADPIERISKKEIEHKMVVDPRAKDFKACMKEVKEGFRLKPVGSFDRELKFIEVEE